jgi:endonuclease/exonuclease/phosphatase (EEP) superfamily protein YafD
LRRSRFFRRLGGFLLWVAAVYPSLLLILSVVHILLPQRTGLLAITQIFAPYLFLPLLLLLPLALIRSARALRIALALCGLIFLLRFTPRPIASTVSDAPTGLRLSVMTWNVEGGGQPDAIRAALTARQADVVALEEVYWDWIQDDPTLTKLYPYRFGLPPRDAFSGMILLSVYPIVEQGVPDISPELWRYPRLLQARIDLGQDRSLQVIAAHPSPAGRKCSLPTCYDSELRDRRVSAIRALADPALQHGQPALLMGDFNLTEREPAYADLSRGLHDAYRQVGIGAGSTWGPHGFLRDRGIPLLRIDYLFSSPNLIPLSAEVDCTSLSSDHCILSGSFELRQP